MTKIIGASALHDALEVLSRQVEACEARGERSIVFCEDRLTLLAEQAVLARLGGTLKTEVTTFARFLSGNVSVLSKQGSVMAIASLLTEREKELSCFRRGAAQAVYETIAQLSASRVDAEMLRTGAEETEGMLRNKLRDLALLLEAYTQFLHESGRVDENGYLALLPERIAEGALADVNVFFFAFPSFTRQAAEGVRAAILHAASVTGIFIAGKEELYTNEGAHTFRALARECGGEHSVMAESSLSGEALLLRDTLFSPDAYSRSPVQSEHIHVFREEDEAREMETVCALIKKHIAEGMRYRDIAVLVPGKESFLTVGQAFSAYRIPYYADRKKAFSEHPLCMFIIDLITAAGDGGLPGSVDAVASSVYFGRGDNYRNYLMKFGGYRGAVRRDIKEGDAVKGYFRDELVACRERMLSCLALFPRRGKGRAFVEGVRELVKLVDAERVTDELAARLSGEQGEFLKLDPLEGVLKEIEDIAGGESFTAREFAATLLSGLSALEISVIPRGYDAVFVGDATESKLSGSKVVFCVGLTDALPRVSTDTAVITDGEIERLAGLRVQIEPAIAVVNARARESLALNLCAFKGELYLGCPLRQRGEEVRPSEVLEMFIGKKKTIFPAPMPEVFPFDCSERQPAARALLRYREKYESGKRCDGDDASDGERFSSLYAALVERGEGDLVDALLSDGKKSVPQAGALYFDGDISPTLLESYFECPYAGFALRGLRLREREERTVLDTDAGTFVHAVLERVAVKFNEIKDEAECRTLAAEAARELLASPRFSSLGDTAAGAYTGERLLSECVEVTAAAYRQLALSSFRVHETEGAISIPALSISGRVDRVDKAGDYVRIIDYKTGEIDDKPTSYYTGRKLQLQLYLSAAAESGKPAGAFYFPAAESFSGPDEIKYRMSGFFSNDEAVLSLMDSTAGGGESAFFEGGESTKGMSQEDFKAFLDYGLLVSEGARREMTEGNITPSPYSGTCDRCKLKGMCAFTGAERKENRLKCADIVKIVRRARGEDV